ncbi:unnamed protein product, partial [Ascophyllum nodosum]
TPVPVKGDQRDLISRYGEQPVQQAQATWACLLDATAGAAFEEGVLSAVTDRVAGTVKISQHASAEKIVAKFGVTRGKPTPMVVGLRLDEFDQEQAEVEEPFRSLVGHLMWLANQTRPDIL